MIIHNFSPILFEIGPVAIRYYSLSYIIGILLGGYYLNYLNSKIQLIKSNKKDIEDLLFRIVVGVIIGGRFGYVFFYNSSYYFQHIGEIFYIWQGGMSFHGGVIGCALGVLYHSRKVKQSFFSYMDLVACSSAIGLFFGRIANFINGELYGKETDLPWGVVFPTSAGKAMHPSQLYEAFLEGAVTFLILFFASKKEFFQKKAGSLSGLFLICYAISRILVEFVRIPDAQIGYLFSFITMGQLLSIPMLILGIFLVFLNKKNGHKVRS